ncbi:MAG TPA: hypothetical protein VHS59_04035 [Bacillota bacterium]|nr:hypothetical protein [Bacillota bacterium]
MSLVYKTIFWGKRVWDYLTEERGDFVQNAIYIALVVIFGISVMTKFGEAIEDNFEAIISKFTETRV